MKKSLVFSLGILLLAGCAAKTPQPSAEAVTGPDGVQRLEVLAGNYFFDPPRLIVRAGQPVELTVVRQSLFVPHTFVLSIPADGIDIHDTISRKGTVIRFTPASVGEHLFFCDKKLGRTHLERGMQGFLEVRP